MLFAEQRAFALMLLLLMLGDIAFVILPSAPPYVQYWPILHPAYLAFAYAIAYGLKQMFQRSGNRTRWLAASAFIIMAFPLVTYYVLAPITLRAFNLTERLGVRDFVGRDTIRFLAVPSRAGDDSARVYAEAVLSALPRDAVLIADWTPYTPLWYLQAVEGRRPDVTLAELSDESLLHEVDRYRGRPVYLADVSRYYDLRSLQSAYRIAPDGLVYRLVPLATDY